jgi:osmotically-inducible protein OsmY
MPADVVLAMQVREKLAATRRNLGDVAVIVDAGHVHLRGRVPSYRLRQVAIENARRVSGVRQVVDELRVDDA